MRRIFYFIFLIFFFSVNLLSQEQFPTDTIIHRLWQQTSLYPQEKIYARTDRPAYVAGDTLRFALQVVNAISHRPETLSRYAYAELHYEDSLLYRVKAKSDSWGAMSGYIPLDKKWKEGCYQLRAYTRYSAFQKEPSVFKRLVLIMSSEHFGGFHSSSLISDDYHVQFFPEGGNCIAGALCRMSF